MKKIFNVLKSIDYRYYICATITVAFILINAFVFPYTFPRLGEAFRDFGLSIGYYFAELFQLEHNISPSVTSLSKMPFTLSDKVPQTWEVFKEKFMLYWQTFADGQTVMDYFLSFRKGLLVFSYVITFIIPVALVLFLGIRSSLNSQNNRYNEDTKPLKAFKKISDKTYRPIKAFLISLFTFVKEYRFRLPTKKKPKKGEIIVPKEISYIEIWTLIWILNFNLITIALELFAYYFYFVSTFDFLSLYTQVYKLLLDLSVIFKFVPVTVWVIVGLIIFDKIRKKRGYDNLWHNELMNRGFINERGVFSVSVAPMRGGKDKFMVDMALSREVMYRDKALEIMRKCDLKFPYFPWINFELSFMSAISKHSVYNLVTTRRFVHSKMSKFYKHHRKRDIFFYDFNRYSLEYDNAKYIETLEDVLLDYAQAFFIYMVRTSLIFSNCSIRVDSQLQSIGNFAIWDDDFFRVRSQDVNYISRFCKIMNWDFFRICRKLGSVPDFAFEFGIVNITEMGKDRPNQVESEGTKKISDETNAKNDGFNDEVKIIGHGAMVDFNCFANITGNDQREQQIPASLLGTAEILRIEENELGKMAMPFFFWEDRLHDLISHIFEKLHKNQRFNKGNNTLVYYILHTIISKYENYYAKRINTFGYERMTISVRDGNKENEKKMHYYYYISNKKTLSKRYATDCFADVLAEKTKQATKGIDDIKSYKKVRPSDAELKETNSFFYPRLRNELLGNSAKKNDDEKDKRLERLILQLNKKKVI